MGQTIFPFGAADAQAISATTALSISDTLTIVTISGQSAAVALTATFSDQLLIGSRVIIKAVQGATGYNVTLGTGFAASAADLTGVANDTDIIELYYDGTSLVNLQGWTKIVDAA